MRHDIERFCARTGADPLLIQGAGGNVSWKEQNTLWIKASGTWLADACSRDIFVPVDLADLMTKAAQSQFDVQPVVLGNSSLRPSIETLLHALMPHTVVAHVHAVEALAHLVQANPQQALSNRLRGQDIKWALVPYKKPGAELARAMHATLKQIPDAEVIFLQNHGLVVGGESVAAVENKLLQVTRLLAITTAAQQSNAETAPRPATPALQSLGYTLLDASNPAHALTSQPSLFKRLDSEWALYPDHVVFLGACSWHYNDEESARQALSKPDAPKPALIFIKDTGIFTQAHLSHAQHAQLQCYVDVLMRLPENEQARSLTPGEVAELLNWDAEKYRSQLSK